MRGNRPRYPGCSTKCTTYSVQVLLRLIALLLTVGMIFISTQVPDLQPSETSALVDTLDDLPFEVVEPAVLPAPDARVAVLPTLGAEPLGHCHELSVFRPPRAALA
jgi:hypothetical protein